MKYLIPEMFQGVYQDACEEYKKNGVYFLQEPYIRQLHQKTGAFARSIEQVVAAARDLILHEQEALYALFLSRAMRDRKNFRPALRHMEIPDEQFPYLALLCLLPAIDELYDFLIQKDLPQDVLQATIGQFEECTFLYEERFGKLGMHRRYLDHVQLYIDHRILNIGRLRFEIKAAANVVMLQSNQTGKQVLLLTSGRMNSDGLYADTPPVREDDCEFDAFFEETDTAYIGTPIDNHGRCQRIRAEFDKSEYFIRVKTGDDILAVHIPSRGALTREACEESYRRALEIFAYFTPQHDFKAFYCHSWMMAPELADILKPDSNVLAFQSKFQKYPSKTKGLDVMNFVFKTETTPYADLPENTSLQRTLKSLYLSGKYLYEYCGFFTMN